MARRSARPKTQPRLELLENRTLLTSIGVDLQGNSPYAGDPTWVDLRHLFLPWGKSSSGSIYSRDPSLPLTSAGYPLAPAGTYANIAHYPNGLYQISYQGTATLTFSGVGRLTTPATLGSDGLYHAVLTVNQSWYPSNLLIMQVTGLNSSNQFGNLHIIMPGYGTNPTQEFTSSFLNDLKPFTFIRTGAWNNVNDSTQVNWQDRVMPNYFTTCGPNGASYEDIIALANESHTNLWINVPAMATNAYITSLAQLVDQDLNPNLSVYVEYSNETWNDFFTEYYQVLAAADKNPLVTEKSNDGLAVAQQTAFQTRNIGDIFKQVFGTEASRVIPVLGGFTVVPYYNQVALQFLQTNYGAVSNSIADFAIAPYVQLTKGTDVKGLTMARLFNSMENYLDTYLSSMLIANESLSKTFGVPVIGYEGGQGLDPSTSKNPALENQAQSNPGMYTLYKNLIAMWEKDIGTPLGLYGLSDHFWGLLTNVTVTGSQKWDAVISSIEPAGDADLDGTVTSADIAIIEAHMGDTNAWWEDGDFNHDGVVDAKDLALAEANLPGTTAAAKFVSQDTTTQGNWHGVYGSDGYNIIGNHSSYPVYAAVTTLNAATAVWTSSTSDVRALQDANTTGATDRTAAVWSSNGMSMTVDVNLPDGNPHVVSIYADDWDDQGRSERVDVIDPSTGTVLDSRTISSFVGGVYLTWQLTGNVQLRFTALTGPNAVMNGIFFEGAGQFQYDPTSTPWIFSGSAGISENNSSFTAGNPPAPEGSQVAFLEDTGSFTQSVSGWAAGSYVLSFDAAQRANIQASQQNFNVLINGHVVDSFTPTSTTYQTYTTAFTVPAGNFTISFQGLDSAGGDNTVFLDQVTVASAGVSSISDPGFEQAVVDDPGFEQQVVVTDQYQYDPTNSPWAFSGNSGIAYNNSAFTSGNPPAPQGSQVAFLQMTGSFSQTVYGWPAGNYVLRFDAAQREVTQARQQDFKVLIDGHFVGAFTPSSTSYESYSTATFTVSSGAHTITFQGLDSAGGDNTAFLDQVAVASVSTPAIGDPGFQQVVGAGKFQYDPTGSPWTFSSMSGISGNNSGFTAGNPPAPEGSQVAFLQKTGSFTQSVTSWAAGTYVVRFDADQRENFQAHHENFSVLIDGRVVGTFTPSSASYLNYSTSAFTVTAGSHTITFQGLDSAGGDNTAFLDQVAVAPVSNSPIGDPGFNQVVVGAGVYQYDPTGSAWGFSGQSGISGDNSGFTSGNPPSPQGSQVAFLQGIGSFSQLDTGWAAGTYVLTFDAAQRENFQASQQDFKVLIDGNVVGTFTPTSSSYQSYTTATFTFTAGAHTITFQGLDSAGGDNTTFLDDVTISSA